MTQKHKKHITEWLQKHCYGYRNALNKADILEALTQVLPGLTDRSFRAVMSELKHQNEVASTSDKGYWFIPPVCTDRAEVDAVLQSIAEDRSRAMSLLEGTSKRAHHWHAIKAKITQGQMELI